MKDYAPIRLIFSNTGWVYLDCEDVNLRMRETDFWKDQLNNSTALDRARYLLEHTDLWEDYQGDL